MPGKRARDSEGLLPGRLGYKQQLACFAAASQAGIAAEGNNDSALATCLLTEVMWGFMSPGKANLIADLAWQDGARGPELFELKSMGTVGTWRRNVWRDIQRKIRLSSSMVGSLLRFQVQFKRGWW